jgi:hypothetical protein
MGRTSKYLYFCNMFLIWIYFLGGEYSDCSWLENGRNQALFFADRFFRAYFCLPKSYPLSGIVGLNPVGMKFTVFGMIIFFFVVL